MPPDSNGVTVNMEVNEQLIKTKVLTLRRCCGGCARFAPGQRVRSYRHRAGGSDVGSGVGGRRGCSCVARTIRLRTTGDGYETPFWLHPVLHWLKQPKKKSFV